MGPPDAKARYVMIGGFLGAGKTTAMLRLAKHLADRGLRTGLISNDQSSGLVDTQILRAGGFAVEEIPGGCFCCRFPSLVQAAEKLTRESRPDVFLAEPVGSCTDLVATVSYPLRRIYGSRYEIAPLSVLVDPHRAARILGLEEGKPFSEKVVYVYRKQLEEADLVVVNKADAVEPALRDRLVAAIGAAFPRARVFAASARTGEGLDPWFDAILAPRRGESAALDIDYDAYAEGEALLGWLNATARVSAPAPFDANVMLVSLVRAVRDALAAEGAEIAHLKATLEAADGSLSVVSVVRTDGEPDLRESILDRLDGGALVVNLRAEADPELLKRVVERCLAALAPDASAAVEHLEHFRPARPRPTHRMSAGGGP
jgi:G3E family GTPase